MKRSMKWGAALAAGLLALSACGSDSDSDGDSGSDAEGGSDLVVGLAYDIGGRGDQSFNDSAAAGLERAAEEFGLEYNELEAGNNETDTQKEERLRLLADAGNNPVLAIGFAYAGPLEKVAADYPDTSFAIVDDSSITAENVANLIFAEQEGSALVGAIAADASETGNIGFVGGVETPLIKKFEAGYIAGAQSVNPEITVQVKYLTQPPDFSGFNDPAKGGGAAAGMYDQGADVVYHAAGGSGSGVFDEAVAAEGLAIGVDSDQYLTASDDVKPVIITSMIKRVDNSVYNMIKSVVDGEPLVGTQEATLEDEGVGYSTSNPAVEPYTAIAEETKQAIIDGEFVVPSTP